MRPHLLAPSLLLLASSAFATPPGNAPAARDDSGPEITLEPVLGVEIGVGVVIEAEIIDVDGVFAPKLSYRSIGETKYFSQEMSPTGMPDRFRGEIPGSSVTGPIEYFVEAYDAQGNGPSRSAPPTRPHTLMVSTAVAPIGPAVRAPDILHQAVARAPQGRSVPIEASFRGPSGVYNPIVYFRRVGSENFTSLSMAELPLSAAAPRAASEDVIIGSSGTGRYVAEVPGAFTNGDIEYYLEVMDSQGNGPTRNGDRSRPHVVRTYEEAKALAENRLVDPDVALVSCLELSRESEPVDAEKLGPCRRPVEATTPAALTRFNLGEVKLRYENYADAVEAFEEATRESPLWPAAWFRLGQASESKRDWAKASVAYARYFELAGKAPEYAALMKRVASVAYELDLEARDRKEAEAKVEVDKKRELEKARKRDVAVKETEKKRQRELWLSAPGSWGFVTFGLEKIRIDGADKSASSLGFRYRGKAASYPFLFFGGGVALTAVQNANPRISISGLLGLNLLALPTPSSARYTLLSPFVAWHPRFFLGKDAPTGTHSIVVGNHFEFGGFSIEVAVGSRIDTDAHETVFDLGLGWRIGEAR